MIMQIETCWIRYCGGKELGLAKILSLELPLVDQLFLYRQW